MRVSTVFVEATGTTREKGTLAEAVNNAVDKFLAEKNGELENYSLSGTVLEQGYYGRTLVTINWNQMQGKSQSKK